MFECALRTSKQQTTNAGIKSLYICTVLFIRLDKNNMGKLQGKMHEVKH